MTLRQAVARAMIVLNPQTEIVVHITDDVIISSNGLIRISKIGTRVFVYREGEHTKDFSSREMKLACAYFIAGIAFEEARKVK